MNIPVIYVDSLLFIYQNISVLNFKTLVILTNHVWFQVQFKLFEVRLPLTQKLTVTFYAKETPLFVDPQAFDDVTHYQRILGYDKPYEFEKNAVNVHKKPVVKPVNKV